jgi:hypothetical protein
VKSATTRIKFELFILFLGNRPTERSLDFKFREGKPSIGEETDIDKSLSDWDGGCRFYHQHPSE